MGIGLRRHVGLLVIVVVLSGCTYIARVSVDSSGGDPNGPSGGVSGFGQSPPAISADGRYVAFESPASDLVPNDGNGDLDVFVRDLKNGVTVRASVDPMGGDANGPSADPSISADGRYVAFASCANDLVPGDGTGCDPFFGDRPRDVFVRDLQTGVTVRASVDTVGGDPDGSSVDPWISADGSNVSFRSEASDLVVGDEGGDDDVFVRNLAAGTTVWASVDMTGDDPNSSLSPFGQGLISADGRYVTFASLASDLVPNDGNGQHDVFVRDLQIGTTVRVSVDGAGADANGSSDSPSISANGSHVAFRSGASDLVNDDDGTTFDVFVRDLQAGTTRRVSVDASGDDPDNHSGQLAVSGDGRYVAFASMASDLVPGDGNETEDIFVRDMRSGSTARASVHLLGGEANDFSSVPSLSADGRYVAFESNATNLIPQDGTGGPDGTDVFIRAVATPTVDSVTPPTVARGSTATLTLTGTNFFTGAQASASLFGPGGVTVNSVTVVSETQLAVSVSVDVAAPTGPRDVWVYNPGTGPGVLATGFGACGGCLTVT